MDNIKLLPIDNSNVENCHAINEDNVPNVGTTTFEEFKALVENSDFHRCIIHENKVIGKNTYEAIQSGLIMGHASMIDSMVEKIILEIDIEPKIILTGGLSKVVQPILTVNVEYIDNLTLVGLEEIFKLNN